MRRYGEPSKDQERLWPHQFCSDCIIATRGYDFREGQVHHSQAPSRVAKYMVKLCGPPSQGWRTLLRNHAPDIAAMDLFVVPYTTNTSECKFATGTAVRF
jgi:hypothetical protein